MCTVFISGSRNIKSLNIKIEQRLINILSQNFLVVIGDANGVDKAVQKFLAEKEYNTVEIYCSGNNCRNNLGNWNLKQIDSNATGRKFYEAKDKIMAKIADYGFVIWDGNSIGSLNNIAELLSQNKKSLVYYLPKKDFITIASNEHLKSLVKDRESNLLNKIQKKGSTYLKKFTDFQQELSLSL
ncbi:hypothetical protein P7M46_08680 [Bisgaard Taxon 10/6]|uniref:hypothetical protein n=1 Tax=Exercitatus varius TaxID=67857 RepID=UPI00294AD1CF|nr:hypothetical protein [Exercitatus varius]MDG2918071.1 hypothetical protein [Exercitatus varius]